MNDPSTDDVDLPNIELFELLVTEFLEGGIETTLIPDMNGIPAQLVFPIEADHLDAERHLRIHTFFVPDVGQPPVLQYFVSLPYTVDPSSRDQLARFVCTLNTNLPLGGFEYSERNEVVAFRHTHAISVRPLDPGVIAWAWSMIRTAVVEFGPLVERVAGGLPVEDAAAEMDTQLDAYVDD